jgi:hydroxypyruvate reductase/glycerate 2-kinase
MNAKLVAEQIFLAGVQSVMPREMIRRHLAVKENVLFIGDRKVAMESFHNIYVIGAGKASAKMALEIENILGGKITSGHVVVKYGHSCELQYVEVTEAGHPIPDANGYAATKKILGIAKQATENDLVICLISGGGSALLADFPNGSSSNDLINLNELLLKSSADIKEINTVRKHLSKVKGGQLAQAVYPAQLVTLILSDVIGDPLDSIASGPTVPDPTTFNDAIVVLEKFNLYSKVPAPLNDYLQNGKEGSHPESPKPGDPVFDNTQNIIIGSNKIALDACRRKAMEEGLNTFIITSELQGDTIEAANKIIESSLSFQKDDHVKKPCCLLFGGETTIKVSGNGAGGRNQHLALLAALLLKDQKGITLLSAGTDGNDGPTDAAGAVVDTKTYDDAVRAGLDIKNYVNNFDSFHFFEKAGGHVVTGPTMTNVMDIIIAIIE